MYLPKNSMVIVFQFIMMFSTARFMFYSQTKKNQIYAFSKIKNK